MIPNGVPPAMLWRSWTECRFPQNARWRATVVCVWQNTVPDQVRFVRWAEQFDHGDQIAIIGVADFDEEFADSIGTW
jgi:hypothetical protein